MNTALYGAQSLKKGVKNAKFSQKPLDKEKNGL
jgi:hypothetical protein